MQSSKFGNMNSFSLKIKKNFHSKRCSLSDEEIVNYVKERFEDVKEQSTMSVLVTFHANNKFLLMAHNQEKLNRLGNIVANHQKYKIKKVLNDYENHLKEALNSQPTIKTHTNVLMHIFGYFGKCLNQKEKEQFMDLIKQFKKNQISIGKVLSRIEPITYQFNNMYLISQTYFLLYSPPNTSQEIKSFQKSPSL